MATRHSKPVVAPISVEAAEVAPNECKHAGFVAYLRTFPGGELDRNRAASRNVEL